MHHLHTMSAKWKIGFPNKVINCAYDFTNKKLFNLGDYENPIMNIRTIEVFLTDTPY